MCRASLSGGFVLSGAVGLAYSLFIATHLRNPAYAPVWEDWIWNAVLPTLAYALLLGMGLVIWRRPACGVVRRGWHLAAAVVRRHPQCLGHRGVDDALQVGREKSEKQTEKKS